MLYYPIRCVWSCGQAGSKQGENAMGTMWGCNGSEGQPRTEAAGRGQDRCLTSRTQRGLLLWVMVFAVGASGCRTGSGGTGGRAGRLPRAGASNRATARPASKRAQAARGSNIPPRSASPARQPARVVSPRTAPSRVPPHARPHLPAWAAQFSRPCHVKRAFRKEIQRLLDEAAAHASASSACMDGPGMRMTVDQVAVCRGPRHGRRWQYYVRYRVTRSREGDTRMCGRRPGNCAWRIPVSSVHYAVLAFSLLRHRRMRIVIPKVSALSGLEDATPLDKPHNGRCYGKRGPFKARTLRR